MRMPPPGGILRSSDTGFPLLNAAYTVIRRTAGRKWNFREPDQKCVALVTAIPRLLDRRDRSHREAFRPRGSHTL